MDIYSQLLLAIKTVKMAIYSQFYILISQYLDLCFFSLLKHRQQSSSLDRNFRNPFTEIPERLPVQPIQSDTQN